MALSTSIGAETSPSLDLLLDETTFAISSRNALTGSIAFAGGGTAFPAKGWSDFPLDLLLGWSAALGTGAATCSLEFIKGPFELRLTRRGARLRGTGYRSSRNGSFAVFEGETDAATLHRTLALAGERCLAWCAAGAHHPRGHGDLQAMVEAAGRGALGSGPRAGRAVALHRRSDRR